MDIYGQAQATSETEGPSSDSDESTVLINTQADENFEESSEKFVETQPQESYNTFESLDQFDSLLDLPSFTQQDTQSIFQQSESLTQATESNAFSRLNPSIGRPTAATQYQRSVSDVVSKLPNRPLSQSILIQSLDIFDLKFLLTRIGVPHGSKSNKTTLSEKVYFALKNGRFTDILPQGAKVVTRNMLPLPGTAQVPMTAGDSSQRLLLARSASLSGVASGPSMTVTAARPGLHVNNTSVSTNAGSSGSQGGGLSSRELVRSASLPAQTTPTQPAMSNKNPLNLHQPPAPSSTVSTTPRVYINTAVLDGAAASWQAVDSDIQAALSRASTTDNTTSSSSSSSSSTDSGSTAESRLYADIERVMHAPPPRQPSADSSAEPTVLGTVVIQASDWRPVEQGIQDALNVNDPHFVSHCLLQLLRTTKHLGSFSKLTLNSDSNTSSSHCTNSNSNGNGGVVVSADSPDTAMQVVSDDSSSSTQQSTNTASNSSSSSMPSLYDIDCSTGEGDTFKCNQSVVVAGSQVGGKVSSARPATRSGVGVAVTTTATAESTIPDVTRKQKKRPHSAVVVEAVSSVAAGKTSVGTDGTAVVASSTTSYDDKNNRKYSDVVASLRERVIPNWTAMRLQQQQQALFSVPATAATAVTQPLIHSVIANNSVSQWQSNTASAATFNATHQTQQQTAVIATSGINNSWRSGTHPYGYRPQSKHGHGMPTAVPPATANVATTGRAQQQLAPLTAAAAPVKLAYFLNISLGLVLAKVRTTDGTEQTVIQSKNSDRGGTQNNNRVGNHSRYKSISHMVHPPQALDPQIARILSVGDRLVSINGTSTEGMPFAVQINMIKTTARPIALGFTSSLY